MKDYSILKALPDEARRLQNIKPHPDKNNFERDRDRILFCRIFRRLDKKTQVFVSGFDDNVRTRLTHSVEVAQIARRIARKLGFDEDLTEAIALGHDTGHTPFGHVGERTLNYFMNNCIKNTNYEAVFNDDNNRGFKHNLQGFKSLNKLEMHRNDETGLNLTAYTLWGVVNHSDTKYTKPCQHYNSNDNTCSKNNETCRLKGKFKLDYYNQFLKQLKDDDWTFEGIIVAMADEIAQLHHDFEDGVCGNLIHHLDLISNVRKHFDSTLFDQIKETDDRVSVLSTFCSGVIERMISKYIGSLKRRMDYIIKTFKIKTHKDFIKNKKNILKFIEGKNITICEYFNNCLEQESFKTLKQWIRQLIINSEITQTMNGKAEFVISKLFSAYLSNPQQLPDKTIFTISNACFKLKKSADIKPLPYKNFKQNCGLARENLNVIVSSNDLDFKTIIMRTICDYIAGMTDDYAISQYNKLYGADNLRYV